VLARPAAELPTLCDHSSMFGRTSSFKLIELFGIRIGVSASWFLVLFLVIFSLSGPYRATLQSSDTIAYATAVASALLFFGSIILHELGHALVARRKGITVQGIDLWLFGGIARLSRDARSPGEDFQIAAAGPLVTLAVVGACLGGGVAAFGAERFFHGTTLATHAGTTPIILLLSWLGTINAVLLVINLLPAFPLDGGRIARALAWRLTGDRGRGTRTAARIGQGFGYALAGLGIFALVNGLVQAGLSALVLGYFMGQASRATMLQTAFSERMDGVSVADIMDSEPVSVPAEMPIGQAREEYFARYGWGWFPVVDAVGRLVGLVRRDPVSDAPDAAQRVHAVMEGGEEWQVEQDQPLESLVASEPLRRLGALLAVDREGVLCGVVTLDQVRRAIAAAATPGVL